MALRGFPPYAWTPTVLSEYLDYLNKYIPEKALPAANIEDVFVVENIIMRPAQGIVEFSGESIPFNFNGDLSSFFHKLSDYMSAQGDQLRAPNFVYDTTGMPILKDDNDNFYDPVEYTKLTSPDITVNLEIEKDSSDKVSYYGVGGITPRWYEYCNYIPRNPLQYLKDHHDNGIDDYLEALNTGLDDTLNYLYEILAIRRQHKCTNWSCDNCSESDAKICNKTFELLLAYRWSTHTYMHVILFQQLGKGISHLADYIGVDRNELLYWIADERTYDNNVTSYMYGTYFSPTATGVSGKPFFTHAIEYPLGPETDDNGKIIGVWMGYMLPKHLQDYSFLKNYSISLEDGEKVVGATMDYDGNLIKETPDTYYFAHLILVPQKFPDIYHYNYNIDVQEHSVKPAYIYSNEDFPVGLKTNVRGMPMFFDPAEPLVIPHGTVKFDNLTAKYDYINYMIDKGKIKPVDNNDRETLNMAGSKLTLKYTKLPFIQRITRYNYPSVEQKGSDDQDEYVSVPLPSWGVDLNLPDEYSYDYEMRVPCRPNFDAILGGSYHVNILAQKFDQNGDPIGGTRICGSGSVTIINDVTLNIQNYEDYKVDECASYYNSIDVKIKGYNGENVFSDTVIASDGEFKIVKSSLNINKLQTTDGSKMLDARLAQI